jgi:hypothetical protein
MFQNCSECTRLPLCHTVCPDDVETLCSESCPNCEIKCDEAQPCNCDPVCEQLNCGWDVKKPLVTANMYPRCELVCERPACEFVDSNSIRLSLWG